MHHEAADFLVRAAELIRPAPVLALDVGSLNVNGAASEWLPFDCMWVGLDVRAGANVSTVGSILDRPAHPVFDLVVSCEMLEHCEDVATAVDRMVGWLRPGGYLLVTCATDNRAPHGVDGGSPGAEHYGNVPPAALRHPELAAVLTECHKGRGDLYLLGRKHGHN